MNAMQCFGMDVDRGADALRSHLTQELRPHGAADGGVKTWVSTDPNTFDLTLRVAVIGKRGKARKSPKTPEETRVYTTVIPDGMRHDALREHIEGFGVLVVLDWLPRPKRPHAGKYRHLQPLAPAVLRPVEVRPKREPVDWAPPEM